MSRAGSESRGVLLIESNPGDVRLFEETFADTQHADSLYVVREGGEALDFLEQEGDYSDAPRPSLVLLDWNLPDVSSTDVLTDIKEDAELRGTPVIVLAGSSSPQSVVEAYDRRANAFIEKPSAVDEFSRMVQAVDEFWFNLTRLPVSEFEEDGIR